MQKLKQMCGGKKRGGNSLEDVTNVLQIMSQNNKINTLVHFVLEQNKTFKNPVSSK